MLRDQLATPLSWAAGRILSVGRPLTRDVSVRRAIGLRAGDGTILRTDHYAPGVADAPTVLVRTPYGRGGVSAVAARMLAGLGFHVVVSSCRGTGGSSGVFDPLRHERSDGLDTVGWLRRQPWFNGRLGTFGPSYVGYTQWAIADVPELRAMATAVTSSQFRDPVYSGSSFALHTTLAWANLLATQQGPWSAAVLELLRGHPRLVRGLAHLPLGEADAVTTGAPVGYYQQWLGLAGAQPADVDAYWRELSHDHLVPTTNAPVLMIGGWHDIFLPWQLRDHAALRAAGARPHLTVGPWTHGSTGLFTTSVRESAAWLRAHLRGETDAVRSKPVRLHVTNAGWREYDDWPPHPGAGQPWYLHAGGRLAPTPPGPGSGGPDRFRYDPADPTPSVGGPVLVGVVSRPRDNRELEARPDVLVFTGDELRRDLDLVGPVSATVHVRPSGPYADVFVRLCDVAPDGESRNVCDALQRVTPGRFPAGVDGVLEVEVELWPVGHRFRAGHRLRVQVSGGAHPRYPRNPGTGEALATATQLRAVEVEVFHDPDHPSAVFLPVIP